MVGDSKIKNAARIFAVAFSFFLYAAAFEPWGVAEFAYVFAIPAILAARSMFSGIPAPRSPAKEYGQMRIARKAQTMAEKKIAAQAI